MLWDLKFNHISTLFVFFFGYTRTCNYNEVLVANDKYSILPLGFLIRAIKSRKLLHKKKQLIYLSPPRVVSPLFLSQVSKGT